jgi:hypothetical protein
MNARDEKFIWENLKRRDKSGRSKGRCGNDIEAYLK